MARTQKKVDAVIVGLGWVGSVMAMELTAAGLDVVALERGPDRKTVPTFAYPKIADELRYAVRYELMQRPADSTVTIRHNTGQTALPYRRLGSFLPGTGVGGAGAHWNGLLWRPNAEELRLKSWIDERFGADIIPDDMTIQDFGVDYDELEPYFDRFEKIVGVSGKAGNLNGAIMDGGNPFEAPRASDYPMPPLEQTYDAVLFAKAARNLGYHPFPKPAANASQVYTNPYGMQLGPCNYCGFCERFGCLNYSKSSPQTCVLDALYQRPNFEYRTNATVLKVELAPDGKTATGVTYADAKGEEVFQPADLVILAAFQLNNVHLMLLSGIGPPYDPATGAGAVGRNYAYQMTGATSLFFKNIDFNPFVGAGANGVAFADLALSQMDFAKNGFIGGGYQSSQQTNGQPIHHLPLPEGTPAWGAGWKKAVGEHYGHSMDIVLQSTNMPYRDAYLDLDPTYRDPFGRPLLRMTFDWRPNELKQAQFFKEKAAEFGREMGADASTSFYPDGHYDTRVYQSTHTVGGAIMGTDRQTSAINRYLQSWDVHNVFAPGANAFPQNFEYNPTGMIGALTLWAARAIREDYLANPRPLM
ncbi:GMC family oxidoreductase [Hoeflea sp. CAU 1731]